MLLKAQRWGKASLKSLLGTFLNAGCAVCDRPTPQTFCLDCHRQIQTDCYPIPGWQLDRHPPIPVGALGPYQGTLKQAILALKYEDRTAVATALGHALARRWTSYVKAHPLHSSGGLLTDKTVFAVPIPLHPNRLAQRGYNQAALIARAFCQLSGLLLAEQGLIRQADTLPQYQLGLADRQKNLAAAFDLSEALKRKHHRSPGGISVLLIDDIYTTGTTTQSAAVTLADCGISVVGMLSLARVVSD